MIHRKEHVSHPVLSLKMSEYRIDPSFASHTKKPEMGRWSQESILRTGQ